MSRPTTSGRRRDISRPPDPRCLGNLRPRQREPEFAGPCGAGRSAKPVAGQQYGKLDERMFSAAVSGRRSRARAHRCCTSSRIPEPASITAAKRNLINALDRLHKSKRPNQPVLDSRIASVIRWPPACRWRPVRRSMSPARLRLHASCTGLAGRYG